MIKNYLSNQEIKASKVCVIIAETNEFLGEMNIKQAIEEAKKRNLDLVEVAPKAIPPVCKIMDLGQFFYQQKKNLQKNKINQKQTEVKGIRLSFRIGEHDLMVKENQARKFLEAGNLVRVVMQFKGREINNVDYGLEKFHLFYAKLEDIAQIESPIKRQNNQATMVLALRKK